MTQDSGGFSSLTTVGAGSSGSQSTTEVARDEAMGVGGSVTEAGAKSLKPRPTR